VVLKTVALLQSKQLPSEGDKDDLFGLAAAERKKTEEGWKIYTEEELKLNKKGGDTPQCPFDCNCCY
jgi:hypothetical protein